MERTRNRKSIFAVMLLCALALTGCVKNYYYECDGSGDDSSGGGGTNAQEYAVKFRANVNQESNAIVRAGTSTPLQQNRYVTVYSFIYQDDNLAELSDYHTVQSGILSPVTGDGLYLPSANYDFYALTIGNKPIYAPTVYDYQTGMVSGLSNGLDYLSCVIEKQTISGPTSLNLTFNHMASQLKVIVESGASTTVVDSIVDATITPPVASSASIFLYTGTILSATSLSTQPLSMAITDSLCQQILLPLKYSGNLTMDFAAYVNGSTTPVNYSVAIPLVNGMLKSGSSYEYKVLINESKVDIATASVNPWTEVDETGTPLNPTPL